MSHSKLSLIFTLATFLLTFLLWLCHDLSPGMELQIKVDILLLTIFCLLYLIVVEEVHEYLHDAREDHQYSGADEEGVDVVK